MNYIFFMNLIYIGALIKQYRLASGISQAELAELASISRATLNYLESGKLNELGASKLFSLMDIMGIQFNMAPAKSVSVDEDAIKKAVKSANASYRNALSVDMLAEALGTGKLPQGYEGNMLYFIDELPESMIIETVRAVAARKKIQPRKVWLNTLKLAKQIQSPRPMWHVAA